MSFTWDPIDIEFGEKIVEPFDISYGGVASIIDHINDNLPSCPAHYVSNYTTARGYVQMNNHSSHYGTYRSSEKVVLYYPKYDLAYNIEKDNKYSPYRGDYFGNVDLTDYDSANTGQNVAGGIGIPTCVSYSTPPYPSPNTCFADHNSFYSNRYDSRHEPHHTDRNSNHQSTTHLYNHTDYYFSKHATFDINIYSFNNSPHHSVENSSVRTGL